MLNRHFACEKEVIQTCIKVGLLGVYFSWTCSADGITLVAVTKFPFTKGKADIGNYCYVLKNASRRSHLCFMQVNCPL